MSGTDQVPIGECPDHGYVTEDRLDLNFPNPARCECGLKLRKVTMADQGKVRELSERNSRQVEPGTDR